MIQYENKEKSIFISRGSILKPELGDSFYVNVAVQKYAKKYDLSNDYECGSCHNIYPSKLMHEVDFGKITDFETLRRVEEKTKTICTNDKDLIERYLYNQNMKPLLISHFHNEPGNSKNAPIPDGKYPLKVAVNNVLK